MKQIALTLLALLLLLGTVFAISSINIISPNDGNIIKGNYNIIFDLKDFNWIDLKESSIDLINVPANNLNSSITNTYLVNPVNCIDNTDRNTCYFLWNTLQKEDGNWKIRIIIRNNNSINDKEQLSANSFTIDNNAPIVSYKFPDNNKWIHPELKNFSFNVSDATSGIDVNSFVVYLDGNIFDTNNSTRFNYNSLTNVLDFNGSDLNLLDRNFYTLSLDINDIAKNRTRIDLNFWVDRNGPYAPDFNLPQTQKDNNVLLTWRETIVTSDVNYFVWKKDSNDLNFYQLPGPINDLNYTDSNT
ncbi:MAG TPA: hypothetical protein PKK60_04250, partial [archaeon]|nr:hypothetical protein [archaeon]